MSIEFRCDHCQAVAHGQGTAGPPTWHRLTIDYDPPVGRDLEGMARWRPQRIHVHADTDACLNALVAKIATLLGQTLAAGGVPQRRGRRTKRS